MKTTTKEIAIDGICNYICRMCELDSDCTGYNWQSERELDQKEFRKRIAGEIVRRGERRR